MKKPTKSIITSSLLAIAFGALSVGTTFALFTSEASTAINVQAGVIDLKAPVTVSSAWELGGTSMTGSGFAWANSIGGSISKDDSNVIHLNKLAPGDGALFALTPDNSGTNVKTKARLVVRLQGELAGALNVEVKAGENTVIAFNGAHTGYTPWEEVEVGDDPTDFTVKVEFPDHDGGEILFGSANKDNQYQNKEATLLINYEAVQGNAQTDDVLQVINTKLMSEAYANGANKTMHDALADLTPEQVAAIEDNGYVWSVEEDQFFDFGQTVPADAYKYFKMFDEIPELQTYSIYAIGNNWTGAQIDNLVVGFDAGDTTGITSVTYDRHEATVGQEVTIRTNTAQTSLTVNAPLDTIHHFGLAGSLNINAIAGNSYHEFGKAIFAEIKTGRMALEKGAEVDQIHLAVTGAGEQAHFDDIVIAKEETVSMPAISRDPVTIPEEGRLVVALQEGTEDITAQTDLDYVWLTAVGVYEQVVVSDQKEDLAVEGAKNSYAADLDQTEQAKKTTAQQIANNITFTDGEEDYKVVAAPVVEDNVVTGWTYEVVKEDGTAVPENTYSATKAANENTVEVEKNNVAIETTVENGMTNAEKDEKQTELVNEAIIPELADQYEEEATAVVYNMNTKAYYEDLYSAINEVPENTKTTLVLLKNISGTSNKNYAIPANKNIVLDLNGKVLNTVAPDESTAYTIENKGILVIKDATDKAKNGSGTGKITSSAVKPDMQDVPGYASNTITNLGSLTVESGIIENRGAGYACFAIDNQTNGNLYTPVLTINGGKMIQESQYHYAVRMFCNSDTKVNKVIVNGGIISGGYGLWLQIPNSKADKAELIINGGAIQANDGYSLFVGGSGANNDTRNYTETTIIINGGNIDSMGLSGVSDSARTLKMFEINGGNIGGLAYGANINPVIASNVVIPE